MVDDNHDNNNNNNVQQTNTDNNQVQVQTNKESEAGCYSPSTSSEDMNEDTNFFQIEGPILTTQFAMDDDDDDKLVPDPKRIPSSVFERSKSKATTDWSVTSNESLFSINVGNTSFSKDYMVLYGKAGGDLADPLAPLPPLPIQSQSSGGEAMAAAESSGEVKMEKKAAGDVKHASSLSVGSDGSTPSFAFPMYGEERRSGSSKNSTNGALSRQSTAQLSQLPEPEEEEAPAAITEPPKVEEAPAPAAAAPAEQQPSPPPAAKWFPCCSCCS